jgi:threonine dehydratase
LLGELAAADASVIEVEHVRTGAHLRLNEVEIAVQVETRGPEHAAELLDRLRDSGYRVTLA